MEKEVKKLTPYLVLRGNEEGSTIVVKALDGFSKVIDMAHSPGSWNVKKNDIVWVHGEVVEFVQPIWNAFRRIYWDQQAAADSPADEPLEKEGSKQPMGHLMKIRMQEKRPEGLLVSPYTVPGQGLSKDYKTADLGGEKFAKVLKVYSNSILIESEDWLTGSHIYLKHGDQTERDLGLDGTIAELHAWIEVAKSAKLSTPDYNDLAEVISNAIGLPDQQLRFLKIYSNFLKSNT